MWRKTTRGKVKSVQGKGKRQKRKRQGEARESMGTIRQQFCCLIEYGELFELCPEGIVVLIVLCFFGGLGIVLDEPGEVHGIVNLLAEPLLAAGGVTYQLVSFFHF